jgi:hypothetical protein
VKRAKYHSKHIPAAIEQERIAPAVDTRCIESLSQQLEKKLVETINSILDLAASARDDDQKDGPDALQAI